ncbi:hypothetical protein Tco_0952210 [Tanacetum coccineum]|uniref:Uncharacterized protein n=1 Tax=Tanacetum coccineum TaxID=301880 RepID=A0ABQ5DWQ9_9ASTR
MRSSLIKNSCISVALTKQPSAYYPKLLREFWYTAEEDAAMKTISFTLSCFEKPLSFDLSVFSSFIGLKPSENCVSLPPKETVNGGLVTLGLFDEKHPHLSYIDLINSTSATTFKPTFENEVALTAHMCKVAVLSPDPIKSLLPPSGVRNADDTADKSSSGTSVQPVTQSKATTIRKLRKKKIPFSTQLKALQSIRVLDQNVQDEVKEFGFETPDSANQESQSDHQDIAANLNTSLVGGDDYNLNASADVPALSDPLGHLRKELHTLSNNVDQLELNISKKVSKDIKSFVPSIFVDSIKAQLRGLLSEALKECLPLIQESIHQSFQQSMEEQLPLFATQVCYIKKELSKVLKTKMGKSISGKVCKGMGTVSDKLASVPSTMATNSQHVQDMRLMFKDMVALLEAAEVFKKANAEGEKWEKNNPETPTKEDDAQIPDPTKGEQHLREKKALVLHASVEKSSEEITSKKNVSDDEPPVKKLKFLIPTSSSILSPTPLNSVQPEPIQKPKVTKMTFEQFSKHLTKTTSSIFSPTPPRELNLLRDPTPLKDESKWKGIETDKPLKDVMLFIEEGGSIPKILSFKSFLIPEGQLTQEDVMAQLKEMKRLADLKAEKETSEKSLQKIMNHATIRAWAKKMADYELREKIC